MRALLLRLEQSRVLDGDHGLGGEGFYKFDLLVAEGPDLSTTNQDGTDSLALSYKWDCHSRAVTHAQGHLGTIRKLLGGRLEIMDMHYLARQYGASCDPTRCNRLVGEVHRDWSVMCPHVEPCAFTEENHGIVCLA